MKTVKISSLHSDYCDDNNYSVIEIKLEGGSPYFGYLWIDNKCYSIIKTNKGYKIKKAK